MKFSKLISHSAAALTALSISVAANAGGHGPSWNLIADDSKVSFGSIKADAVGESHRFKSLIGAVDDNGVATVEIDLTSVDTGVEIRDTRMNREVFDGTGPTATLIANIDPKVLNDLEAGATSSIDVSGKLSLGENMVDITTKMFVAKLSDKKIMVTTDEMIMVSAEALGITAGIDKLMELAKLPSITRVVPVTLRLVFETS